MTLIQNSFFFVADKLTKQIENFSTYKHVRKWNARCDFTYNKLYFMYQNTLKKKEKKEKKTMRDTEELIPFVKRLFYLMRDLIFEILFKIRHKKKQKETRRKLK